MHITVVAADFPHSERSQVVISVLPFFAVRVVGRSNDEIEHVDVDDMIGQNVTIGLAETKSQFPRFFRVDAYDDKVFRLHHTLLDSLPSRILAAVKRMIWKKVQIRPCSL